MGFSPVQPGCSVGLVVLAGCDTGSKEVGPIRIAMSRVVVYLPTIGVRFASYVSRVTGNIKAGFGPSELNLSHLRLKPRFN